MRAALLGIVALATCSCRTPAPTEQHPLPAASGAGARATDAEDASADASEPRVVRPLDGCLAGIEQRGSASELLARLAESCAPGMSRLGAATRASSADGGPPQARFAVADPSACVRILAASDDASQSLGLELFDPDGSERATTRVPGPIAVLGERGPICLNRGGELRVVVSAGRDVSIEVWRSQ